MTEHFFYGLNVTLPMKARRCRDFISAVSFANLEPSERSSEWLMSDISAGWGQYYSQQPLS